MASSLKSIIAQVGTQLANINGAGVYTYDVSATGAVVRGAMVQPPISPPCVAYWHMVTTSKPGPVLTKFTRTTTIGIHGWTAHDGTEGDGSDAASDLFNDILRAIEADRTLSNQVHDVKIGGTFFGGAEFDADRGGMVVAELELTYPIVTGA